MKFVVIFFMLFFTYIFFIAKIKVKLIFELKNFKNSIYIEILLGSIIILKKMLWNEKNILKLIEIKIIDYISYKKEVYEHPYTILNKESKIKA